MHFSLSEREANTKRLCSLCQHLVDGECENLIITPDGSKFRLARFSVSGGECQLFEPKNRFFKFPKWFDPETEYDFVIQRRREKE